MRMVISSTILESLFLTIPQLSDHHSPQSQVYELLKKVARQEVDRLFNSSEGETVDFQPFGDLIFPYHKMGAVDSLNLFDLDELILFSFYWANRSHYHRVLDIGANIGLHSIILDRCGFEVVSYEPDPEHFEILNRNLELNRCLNVKTFNAAVSSVSGTKEFVRVLGNTTGSHLAGCKTNVYGDLERFSVPLTGIDSLILEADFLKLDVEGHEAEILLSTNHSHWRETDAMVEVGNERNAALIYEHCSRLGVSLYSQKNHWCRVREVGEVPTSYREGMLFISSKNEVPWR